MSNIFQTVKEYDDAIVAWAEARDIIQHSTAEAQLYKLCEEYGELGGAIAKNRIHKIKDGIGDTYVCLVNHCKIAYNLTPSAFTVPFVADNRNPYFVGNRIIANIAEAAVALTDGCTCSAGRMAGLLYYLASLNGLEFVDCIDAAYVEIKDRKGQMQPGGVFVKDGDV